MAQRQVMPFDSPGTVLEVGLPPHHAVRKILKPQLDFTEAREESEEGIA